MQSRLSDAAKVWGGMVGLGSLQGLSGGCELAAGWQTINACLLVLGRIFAITDNLDYWLHSGEYHTTLLDVCVIGRSSKKKRRMVSALQRGSGSSSVTVMPGSADRIPEIGVSLLQPHSSPLRCLHSLIFPGAQMLGRLSEANSKPFNDNP